MISTILFAAAIAASPTPFPAPSGEPLPSPAAQPAPIVTPAGTASETPYAYRFVPHVPPSPDPNQPVIYAVYLNSDTLHSKKPIMMRIETSACVVKVTSGSNGRVGVVPNVSPGVFAANSVLPSIPFIARGSTTKLTFVATSSDGRTFSVAVPVTLE